MNVSWIIWSAIYILISLILYDSIKDEEDATTKLAVCITWPLLFVAFMIIAVILIIVSLLYLLLRSIYNLWESLNGK